MRKLELVFKTSDEKLKTLSINYANLWCIRYKSKIGRKGGSCHPAPSCVYLLM
ncbi:hypothetical protein C5L32_001826 [Lentilactobacillus buchneri]|uniref:Uncharacterized protein n=1 Tax=Lentilactobacillus buchneri DSM 20057 TaxID=1423728 RepID=A0A4R5NUF2_LENBU|nr:hypothetical protein C5L32_001826 [Lentilactobacillus buchneri]GEP13888.1 hypothetical protein LBU01_10330 [Lentilactobacillus buchneri]